MTTQEAPFSGERGEPDRGINRIPRRRLLLDRWNRALIAAGGQGVIALILAMFVFLVIEAWPLARAPQLDAVQELGVDVPAAAVVSDPYRTHVAVLGNDAVVRVWRSEGGAAVLEQSLLPAPAPSEAGSMDPAAGTALAPAVHRVFPHTEGQPLVATTTDGGVVVAELDWEIEFVDNKRVVTPAVRESRIVPLDPAGGPVEVATARATREQTTIAGRLAGGEIAVHRTAFEENLFTGERSETTSRETLAAPFDVRHLVVDPDQRTLYAAGAAGELAWWSLDDGATPSEVLRDATSPVTAMTLLKGGQTLVVGRADGSLENWFRIRQSLAEHLTRVRILDPLGAAVTKLSPSGRDRTFLAVDAAGGQALYFASSGERLWTGAGSVGTVEAAALSPKGDALLLAGAGSLAVRALSSPHPEASWTTYFGRIWYEGFEKAEAVWQSTGGTDDFESKLSLLPLVFGTLKGTLYSLILAVPIAILGAMYTSQFMHPRFQRIIKPTVEMMASLPSVVLGLVAGLWLAPRLETHFPAMVAVLAVTPVLLVGSGWLWERLPAAIRARFPTGAEVIWFSAALALGWAVLFSLGTSIEAVAFGGDYQAWLLDRLDLRYDQRNAAVVGIAMGFAVIPIIFSIAEDAFSSVPQTLAAGSLALGANRWETVTRVILPTASPAIFSAVMVGLGRAVGETMIVLMATGNTPIMDWSPFNGFRTLSANIAVEIPEAPHGATLYRTLFLTALVLFAFTFVINTFAELIRVRLREKFGRL